MDITTKTIGEIGEYLGYSSQSHFQRVFKKETQMTPGQYRAKRRK
jgi:AraC-like DNA-binding protein